MNRLVQAQAALRMEASHPSARPSTPPPRRGRKWTRQLAVAALFLLPNLAGFLTFTLLPVFVSIGLSLTDWDLLRPPRFVGIGNFIKALGFTRHDGQWSANDPDFWKYLWNTLYLMTAIPLGMACSLGLALALNRRLRGRIVLRTIYFLPSMCVPVAVYLLWRWIYNPDFGLLNWALERVGLTGPKWLESTTWSKPALMLAGLWATVGGYNMILYLAGLQGIPREYYEAAEIDGASGWQRFAHITWPLLSPTTFFILVISLIAGFQGGFDAAYIITGGGPAGSTTTLMFYIYNNAFVWSKMGYAATIAWVLFVMVFAVTLLSWKFGGRHVHYH